MVESGCIAMSQKNHRSFKSGNCWQNTLPEFATSIQTFEMNSWLPIGIPRTLVPVWEIAISFDNKSGNAEGNGHYSSHFLF